MDCSDIVVWCHDNVFPRQVLGEDWEDWIHEAVCEYMESGTPATLGNVLVRAKSRRIDHLRRARRMRSLVQEPAIVDCCTVEISDSFQAIMDCLPGLLRERIIQLRESEGDRRACCSALSISPELLRKRLQRMREMINNGCSQEPH